MFEEEEMKNLFILASALSIICISTNASHSVQTLKIDPVIAAFYYPRYGNITIDGY